MSVQLRDRVRQFFDDFVEAFHGFDGESVAARYQSPYVAMNAAGEMKLFSSGVEIACYFQQILDEYYAGGCRSCRYKDMEVVPAGARCVLATVTWVLLDTEGAELSAWRESYNISLHGEEMKIFSSIDH